MVDILLACDGGGVKIYPQQKMFHPYLKPGETHPGFKKSGDEPFFYKSNQCKSSTSRPSTIQP